MPLIFLTGPFNPIFLYPIFRTRHEILAMEKILILIILMVSVNIGHSQELDYHVDCKNIETIIDLVSRKELKIKQIRKLDQLELIKEEYLFRQSKKYTFTFVGKTVSLRFKILTINKDIFSVNISIPKHDLDEFKEIIKLNNPFNKEIHFEEQEYFWVIWNKKYQEQFNKFRELHEQAFGKFQEVEIEHSIKEDYLKLLDPNQDLFYGDKCGRGAIELNLRKAIEKLIEQKQIVLISNVLKGYNPAGRAFAIEALLRIKNENNQMLDEEIQSLLKKIKNKYSSISIEFCYGCFGEIITYKDIFQNFEK